MSRIPVCVALLCMFGCGGSCPGAEGPSTENGDTPKPVAAEPKEEVYPTPASVTPQAEELQTTEKKEEPVADVKFPEGASVAQAQAAVPRGAARSNIDPDELAEPLQSEALWAPCKVGTQHFKVKVAVWNGQAVGVDVTTTSKPLAACVEKQVRSVEWRDKVRSLNAVEYSM